MAHFVGFAASDDALHDSLLRSVGSNARSWRIPGVTIVTCGAGGEPVTISSCDDVGEVTVRRGDTRTGGCAVTLFTRSQRLPRFESEEFGQQSLFTARTTGGTICFATDPRLLRTIVSASLSSDALKGYLCFSHIPYPLTLWKGIFAVQPPRTTWTGETEHYSEEIGVGELHELLRGAVERRLTTRDIGIYLSGGLDSSLIAALLVEAGVRPRLFSLDFGPPYNLELPVAQAVASHLGLPLTIVPARPHHVLAAVRATARALPQPFGDSVTVPLYLLGRAARDLVSEVWNGEGGDQVFGGWANKPMIAALTHGGDMSEEAELREYLETYHRFGSTADRLLSPTLRTAASRADPAVWVRPALDRKAYPSLLHRLRAANLLLKGAQNIAPRMTALAECHGLRVLAPFFDRALTEATFALAPEKLLAGACEKHLLKQVAEKYLPADVVWRQKRGMGVPSTEWCLRPGILGWDVRRRLSSRRLRAQGWFENDLIRRLFLGDDPSTEGSFRRRRVGEKLWLLYMLQVWCDENEGRDLGGFSGAAP